MSVSTPPLSVPFVEITTAFLDDTIRTLERFGFVRDMLLYKERTVLRQQEVTLFVIPASDIKERPIRLETYLSRVGLLYEDLESQKDLFCESMDIHSPAGIVFHKIDKRNWDRWGRTRNSRIHASQETTLMHIDHVAFNVFPSQLEAMDAWLKTHLGLTPLRPHAIKGKATSFVCSPYEAQGFSFVLNTSECATSQISTFLNVSQAAAVQHLAFGVTDILSALRKVREKGVSFIQIPDQYYDTLLQEKGIPQEQVSVLKEASVLLDQDPRLSDRQLLQTFTKDLFGPIFFELIERRTRKGFGEGNIEALFKAVEAQIAS
ncbi:MAG: VOC family protein [Alphaproteobacteria bacterium]|nr:VOC family protein [Alphaproteobacteria bacterium]